MIHSLFEIYHFPCFIASYEQHDDPDVIIPFRLSRPLVYSAHLLLINGIVALVFGDYGLFAVLFFVYCTSIVHWSKPRFSAIARFVDYFAVLCAVTYGSVFVVLLEEQNVKEAQSLITMWFVGLCIIAVIFVCNEVRNVVKERILARLYVCD